MRVSFLGSDSQFEKDTVIIAHFILIAKCLLMCILKPTPVRKVICMET